MRTFLTILLSLVLMSCHVSPAYADMDREVRVAFLGWSQHWLKVDVTNENHEILAVEYMGWSAGRFDNSYGRETWFISKNIRWQNVGLENLNGIAAVGLNRGYKGCFNDQGNTSNICPHGYVGFEYETDVITYSFKLQPGVVIFNPEVKFSW